MSNVGSFEKVVSEQSKTDAEKFMGILIWSQQRKCKCIACEYFYELGMKMVSEHVKVK